MHFSSEYIQQLVTLLLTRQIIDSIREIFLPLGHSRLRQVWLSLKYEQRCLAERNKLKSEDNNGSLATFNPSSSSSLSLAQPSKTDSDVDKCSILPENKSQYVDNNITRIDVDVNSEILIHQRIQKVTEKNKLNNNSKSFGKIVMFYSIY